MSFRRVLSVSVAACALPVAWPVRAARHQLLTTQSSALKPPVDLHVATTVDAAVSEQPHVQLFQYTSSVVKATAANQGVVEFTQAFVQSFTLMCTAEIFDRTWFVTLLSSLHHGALVSFLASMAALSLHSCMAMTFGSGVASLLPKWTMELGSAILLGIFAAIYAWEYYKADAGQDALKGRMEEAQEDTPQVESVGNPQSPESSVETAKVVKAADPAEVAPTKSVFRASFAAIFVAVFIAEWGDRTQIVQITLAASLPVLPVFLGSLSGLLLLCLSAVALARVMEGREVNERFINIVCFMSFGIMAAVALHNARSEFLVARGV